jgi:hypothetical protein
MSDTEPREGLPSTLPPPPNEAAEAAAVGLVHGKLDRALSMLEKMYLMMLEDKEDRQQIRDRLDALEAIPPPGRLLTIVPPPNGSMDG